MAIPQDLRAQIILGLKAEGQGVADRLAQEIARVKQTVDQSNAAFAEGSTSAAEYREAMRACGSALNELVSLYNAAQVAVRGYDAESRKAFTSLEQLTSQAIDLGLKRAAASERDAEKDSEAWHRNAAKKMSAIMATETAWAAAGVHINNVLEEMESAEIHEAEVMAAAARRHETEMGRTVQASSAYARNLSFTFLAFGHAVQDFTSAGNDFGRGLTYTLNNVPMLAEGAARALGLSTAAAMAWAGGLAIAGSAALVLYNNWDNLKNLLDISPVKDEAERMEELGKKTHKTAEETAEYNKLKKEQNEIEQMMAARSKEERAISHAIQEAYSEAGTEKVLKGVAETQIARGFGAKWTPEDVQEYGRALDEERKGGLFAEGGARAKARIEARIAAENAQRAQDLMLRAKTDPSAMDELLTLVRKNPGAFPPGFAETLIAARQAGVPKAEEREAEEGMARTHDELTERARDVLQGHVDAGDIDERMHWMLTEQRFAGATPEAAFEAVRAAAHGELLGVLKGRKLSTAGAQDEAERRARRVAAQAEKQYEGEPKRIAAERGRVQGAAERGLEQLVKQEASRIGAVFGHEHGPGSIEHAMLNRIRAGQAAGDIVHDMHGQVRQAVGEMGVPANIVDEVANHILEAAEAQARAKAVALGVRVGGGAREGARNLMAAAEEKAMDAQDREGRREAKLNRGAEEHALAQQIFAESPATPFGQFTPHQAMQAAHRAMQLQAQNFDQRAAVEMGMIDVMNGVVAAQEHAQAQINNIQMQMMGLQGRVGRGRMRLPGLMPTLRPN